MKCYIYQQTFMGIIFIILAFAFVASILSLIPKILFFLHQRNTYEIILKYSLIGILIGSVISFLFYLNNKPSNLDEAESEKLLFIPSCFMLLGIIIGAIQAYRFSIRK